ncbi:oxidoreductase [Kineosporia babensis]|uniref:SDR family NAD(P)-dependent oxidoreductase n=1 Tax=Kineosporia babensis TaxID=499548 RepID=A0A9X1NIN8_9ACTN|nr:oxidoreductase [Kineosporia babensis]MCD5315757.1 SDR family NAD(P)-dependent oxidoreductase [Kineosporia babensis]
MATWLITGCSTGLGRALAESALKAGHQVVLTARDPSSIADLAAAYPETALAERLDVTDKARIGEVVEAALARFGQIDVLVNNAGYGYRAAVEEADDTDVHHLFATNVFGAVHLIQAVLPGMRERRSGTILNISSIGARLTPSGSGFYSATKAALEGITGSLRKEVAPLGIRAVVVEPGAFRTDFAGRSLTQSARAITDYAPTAGVRRKENDKVHGTQPGDPVLAARALLAVADSDDPPALLLLGNDALQAYTAGRDALDTDVQNWRAVSAGTDLVG